MASGCIRSISAPDNRSNSHDELLKVGLSAREAVVKVGQGTGWINQQGEVVTCSHVVDSETVRIETFQGDQFEGSIIQRFPEKDIAILAPNVNTIEGLPLHSQQFTERLPVIKIGHPSAVGTWIISVGTILRADSDEILTDVPCGPGDSGSPLLTGDGTVVGHVTGSTVLVTDPEDLDRPSHLVQEFTGQRHVSRAHGITKIEPLF